jgi:hypothetical protein
MIFVFALLQAAGFFLFHAFAIAGLLVIIGGALIISGNPIALGLISPMMVLFHFVMGDRLVATHSRSRQSRPCLDIRVADDFRPLRNGAETEALGRGAIQAEGFVRAPFGGPLLTNIIPTLHLHCARNGDELALQLQELIHCFVDRPASALNFFAR